MQSPYLLLLAWFLHQWIHLSVFLNTCTPIWTDIDLSFLPIITIWSNLKFVFNSTYKPSLGSLEMKELPVELPLKTECQLMVEQWRQEVYASTTKSNIIDREYYICSPSEDIASFATLILDCISLSSIVNSLVTIVLLNLIIMTIKWLYRLLKPLIVEYIILLLIFYLILPLCVIYLFTILPILVVYILLFMLLHIIFLHLSKFSKYNLFLLGIPVNVIQQNGSDVSINTVDMEETIDSESDTGSDDYIWINTQPASPPIVETSSGASSDTESDVSIDLEDNVDFSGLLLLAEASQLNQDNGASTDSESDYDYWIISDDASLPSDRSFAPINSFTSDSDSDMDDIHIQGVSLESIISIIITVIIINTIKYLYRKMKQWYFLSIFPFICCSNNKAFDIDSIPQEGSEVTELVFITQHDDITWIDSETDYTIKHSLFEDSRWGNNTNINNISTISTMGEPSSLRSSFVSDYGETLDKDKLINFNKMNKPLPPLPEDGHEVTIKPFDVDVPVTAVRTSFGSILRDDQDSVDRLIALLGDDFSNQESIRNSIMSTVQSNSSILGSPVQLTESQVNLLATQLKQLLPESTTSSIVKSLLSAAPLLIIDMDLVQYEDFCNNLDKPLSLVILLKLSILLFV